MSLMKNELFLKIAPLAMLTLLAAWVALGEVLLARTV